MQYLLVLQCCITPPFPSLPLLSWNRQLLKRGFIVIVVGPVRLRGKENSAGRKVVPFVFFSSCLICSRWYWTNSPRFGLSRGKDLAGMFLFYFLFGGQGRIMVGFTRVSYDTCRWMRWDFPGWGGGFTPVCGEGWEEGRKEEMNTRAIDWSVRKVLSFLPFLLSFSLIVESEFDDDAHN